MRAMRAPTDSPWVEARVRLSSGEEMAPGRGGDGSVATEGDGSGGALDPVGPPAEGDDASEGDGGDALDPAGPPTMGGGGVVAGAPGNGGGGASVPISW